MNILMLQFLLGNELRDIEPLPCHLAVKNGLVVFDLGFCKDLCKELTLLMTADLAGAIPREACR